MKEQDRNRLAAALGRLTLTLHKDLQATTLDADGKPLTVIDVFEELFEHCDMDRIELACQDLLMHEDYFPTPATLMRYYRANEPIRAALPSADRPLTQDEKRRQNLVSFFMTRWVFVEDPKKRKKLLDECSQPKLMEAFIKEHWDSDIALAREKREAGHKRELRKI